MRSVVCRASEQPLMTSVVFFWVVASAVACDLPRNLKES
jgi:hypothetical protein